VALLLAGTVIRSQPARLASAVVILITVVKVFLFDLAGIGGVWRALSFIGLGLVLVGIGWLYQRLLFPPRSETAAPARRGSRHRRVTCWRATAALDPATLRPGAAKAQHLH
jgi:uncharacterized membrane protein